MTAEDTEMSRVREALVALEMTRMGPKDTRPTYLYLGGANWRRLKEEIRECMTASLAIYDTSELRPTFMGAHIFVVDAPEHLNAAFAE